jgi:hypothetical protein
MLATFTNASERTAFYRTGTSFDSRKALDLLFFLSYHFFVLSAHREKE